MEHRRSAASPREVRTSRPRGCAHPPGQAQNDLSLQPSRSLDAPRRGIITSQETRGVVASISERKTGVKHSSVRFPTTRADRLFVASAIVSGGEPTPEEHKALEGLRLRG